jgi:hypothetical protein
MNDFPNTLFTKYTNNHSAVIRSGNGLQAPRLK